MVGLLHCTSSCLGFEAMAIKGLCIVFLRKRLYSHTISPLVGVQMASGCI